jgi:hypothetical protein
VTSENNPIESGPIRSSLGAKLPNEIVQVALAPLPCSVHVCVGAPSAVTVTVPVGVSLFVRFVTVTLQSAGSSGKPNRITTAGVQVIVVVVWQVYIAHDADADADGVAAAVSVVVLPPAGVDGPLEVWPPNRCSAGSEKKLPKLNAPAVPVPIAANMITAVTRVRLRIKPPLATRRPLPRFNIRVLA